MQNPPKGAIPHTGEFFLLGSSSPPSKPLPLKLHFDALLLTACLQDALLQQPGTAFGGAELWWRRFSHGKSSGSLPKFRFPIPNLLSRLLHPVPARRPSAWEKETWEWGRGIKGGAFASSAAPGASFGGAGRWGARPRGPLTAGHHFPSGYPRCTGGSPVGHRAVIFSASVKAIVCNCWAGDKVRWVPVAQLPLQFLIPLLPSRLQGPAASSGFAKACRAPRAPLHAQPFCKGGGKTPSKSRGTVTPLLFSCSPPHRKATDMERLRRDLKAADGKGAALTVYLPRAAGLSRARGQAAWPGGSSCDEKSYGKIKVPQRLSRRQRRAWALLPLGALCLQAKDGEGWMLTWLVSLGWSPFWGLTQPLCQTLVLLSSGWGG